MQNKKCKHANCVRPVREGNQECDGCYEVRTRIEWEPGKAMKFLAETLQKSGAKYLSGEESRSLGLVHEINRTLLHPAGLALEVYPESGLLMIQDHRDDPEGVSYADECLSLEKRTAYLGLVIAKAKARTAALGFIVQPVPGGPKASAGSVETRLEQLEAILRELSDEELPLGENPFDFILHLQRKAAAALEYANLTPVADGSKHCENPFCPVCGNPEARYETS